MIHNIPFAGIAHTTSDHTTRDGALDLSINMIYEDGALQPIHPPSVVQSIPLGYKVLYIHETSGFKNIILSSRDTHQATLSYLPYGEKGVATAIPTALEESENIRQVTSLGNTLIVLTSQGIKYFYYQSASYKSIGGKLPDIPLNFGLKGEMVPGAWEDRIGSSNFEISPTKEAFIATKDDGTYFKGLAERIMASAAKFLQRYVYEENKFFFPFFVRYAIRMYDGTLTNHSAPIFMQANNYPPQLVRRDAEDYRVMGMVHSLDYGLAGGVSLAGLIAQLEEWRDLIQSVDIFISAPIYTYEVEPKMPQSFSEFGSSKFHNSRRKSRYEGTFSVCKYEGADPYYRKVTLREQFDTYIRNNGTAVINEGLSEWTLCLVAKSPDEIQEAIDNTSVYRLIASISIDELANIGSDRQALRIKKGVIKNLNVQEAMSDDYGSHDHITAEQAFVYNSRLNLSGITKSLYTGYTLGTIAQYTNVDTPKESYAFFYIREGGKEIVVKSKRGYINVDNALSWMYYPNPNCYKAIILQTLEGGRHQAYEWRLKAHPLLYGAFASRSYFYDYFDIRHLPDADVTDNNSIEQSGKIYTSEVNNPFVFPARGINTIGTGRVIGMATATKALSEGQYGQFPLYAFTSEGVWALEVSSNGTYSSKNPTTRDVCLNPDSITQIDTAVLFTSQRGIMLLQGAQCICISEEIHRNNFKPSTLDGYATLLQHAHLPEALTPQPLEVMLHTLRMIYDYPHQRIIVYTPSTDASQKHLAYVYSLKSKAWGMMITNISHHVNIYPETIAVDGEGSLLDYSQRDATASPFVLGITRPLHLEARDSYKTIRDLCLRGELADSTFATALYGTHDLKHYDIIASSLSERISGISGSPYKAYRLAFVGKLGESENLTAVSISAINKHGNRMR